MKNTIGGKGHKKAKNHTHGLGSRKVPLRSEDEGTDYAYVLEKLGSGRLKVYCYSDQKERIATIRGSMYKRVWIDNDDVVLVSMRDFDAQESARAKAKCDVIAKYTAYEVDYLVKNEELSSHYASLAKKELVQDDKDSVLFEEEAIDIDAI